jgi:hypothetical protein
MCTRYRPSDRTAWDRHIALAKNGHFMFMRVYMEYHAHRFADHSLLFWEKNRLLAVMPANEEGQTLHSHQGLTFGGMIMEKGIRAGQVLQIFEVFKTYCLENGFEKVIYKAMPYIYHQYPSQEDLYALFLQNAHVYRRDLSTCIDLPTALPFTALRRRRMRRAKGLSLQPSSDYEGFMGVLSEALERHGVKPVHSSAELAYLAGQFPEHIQLFTATHGQNLLAGVVVYHQGNWAHAQYIAASAEGKAKGALDRLFQHLLQNVFPHKKYFNFGISTENQGLLLNKGLVFHKEGFGGRGICHDFYEWNLKK